MRKTFQAVAFTGPALMLLALSRPDLPLRAAVACMTAALGASSLGALCLRNAMPQLHHNCALHQPCM